MSRSIAIIDADPSAAQTTCTLVQHLMPTATVTCEHSAEQGWNMIQAQSPDALIIDPSSFGPAGTLVMRLCRETWPNITIIALVARRHGQRAARLDADVYIDKGSDPAQLNDALRDVLT